MSNAGMDTRQVALHAIKHRAQRLQDADTFLRNAVDLARENGATWEDIGTTLGISKQAAWERFSK